MPARSALLFPDPVLSGCIFAGIWRDTRGAVLSDEERFNHFPASPLVSVTYVVSGRLRMVATGAGVQDAQVAPMMGNLTVVPPQDAPVTSWSASSIAAITVGFYPEAWEKLQGAGNTDDIQDALVSAFSGIASSDDCNSCWAAFQDDIARRWHNARTRTGIADWTGSHRVSDWARSMLGRAAMAGPGRSARALERRLRRWSRQSRQSLRFYADLENLHRLSAQNPDLSPAMIANDAGYADQSHMGRAVRRGTGFSPARLNRLVETEEAFWCYRLLGERF